MYQIEFLPVARQDLTDITLYIAQTLKNEKAAYRLAEELVEAAERLGIFPYANPVYQPLRPLSYEYRRVSVKNYLLFYTADEPGKTVTIHRIIYAKRNYEEWMR